MSSTRKTIALTVASAGALAAVVSATSASAGTPSGGTFTVIAHHHSEANVDLGARGFSAGDEDLMTSWLGRGGDRVGWLSGSCTTLRASRTSEDQLCNFQFVLGSDQLTASGNVRSTPTGPGTFRLPITGGTGRYLGVGGQITITAGNDTGGLPITITVVR